MDMDTSERDQIPDSHLDDHGDGPPLGEETLDAPVMDGAEELQAEAAAAIESGEVDLTDTRRGGPSVADRRADRD